MASKSDSSRAPTVTRAELATVAYTRAKLSRAEAFGLVDMMLDEMVAALSRGENVKLSSFGAFMLRYKNERMGRNPKTGVVAPIAARRVVKFRPSRTLRDRVDNRARAKFRATKEPCRTQSE